MVTNRIAFTLAGLGMLTSFVLAQNSGSIAIGPISYADGNKTSRELAVETIRKIVEHKGYTVLPQERIDRRLESLQPSIAYRKGAPVLGDLARFAATVHASKLVFGKIGWHTRSVWVGAGPKTISTATVDIAIYDANRDSVTYEKHGIQGRSDEKEGTLKLIADVIVTPFVTVVSGGPSTPREQRAVQIALGKALEPWVHGARR
ncbi:MAG: hypothetical protein P4L46_21180 [Fimbriimonas sp.]|nr:hypothetical protein [Fimbriimonas sp.]